MYFTGIGQPLSMLLKLNPAVTKLNLYDIVHTPGVASDLSHCETKSTSTGFVGKYFCTKHYILEKENIDQILIIHQNLIVFVIK